MRQTLLTALLIIVVAVLIWQQIGNIGKVTVREITKIAPGENKIRYVTITGTVDAQRPGRIEKAPYSIVIKEQSPGGDFEIDAEHTVLPDVMKVDAVDTTYKLDLLSVFRAGVGARYVAHDIIAMPFLAANVRVWNVVEAGVGTDFETIGVDVAARYRNVGAYVYTDFEFDRIEAGLMFKPF